MNGRPQDNIDFCILLVDREMYSFADLELVVNEAARDALQARHPITNEHLEDAFKRITPSINSMMIEEMSRE